MPESVNFRIRRSRSISNFPSDRDRGFALGSGNSDSSSSSSRFLEIDKIPKPATLPAAAAFVVMVSSSSSPSLQSQSPSCPDFSSPASSQRRSTMTTTRSRSRGTGVRVNGGYGGVLHLRSRSILKGQVSVRSVVKDPTPSYPDFSCPDFCYPSDTKERPPPPKRLKCRQAPPTFPMTPPNFPLAPPTQQIAPPTFPITPPTQQIAPPTFPITPPTQQIAPPTFPITPPTLPLLVQPEPMADPAGLRVRRRPFVIPFFPPPCWDDGKAPPPPKSSRKICPEGGVGARRSGFFADLDRLNARIRMRSQQPGQGPGLLGLRPGRVVAGAQGQAAAGARVSSTSAPQATPRTLEPRPFLETRVVGLIKYKFFKLQQICVRGSRRVECADAFVDKLGMLKTELKPRLKLKANVNAPHQG